MFCCVKKATYLEYVISLSNLKLSKHETCKYSYYVNICLIKK